MNIEYYPCEPKQGERCDECGINATIAFQAATDDGTGYYVDRVAFCDEHCFNSLSKLSEEEWNRHGINQS